MTPTEERSAPIKKKTYDSKTRKPRNSLEETIRWRKNCCILNKGE